MEFVSILTSIFGAFFEHFPYWCPQDTNMDPKGTQGCRNEAPRSPQSAQKPPNYTPCVSKWKPKVPQWNQKATQSAKEIPQGLAKCHKDPKNMYNPPAAGCSPKAT